MQLEEFNTLQDAKNYIAPKERMISQDMIVSFLTVNDCITTLQESANEKAKGFYLAVSSGVQEFNLMNSHPVGQAQQSLLAYLVLINAANQAFADDCISYANSTYKPHENKTKHDFDLAKGTITRVSKQAVNGWLKITTSADCEAHRPQICVDVQGVFQRVAGFNVVSVTGDYVAQVPRGYTEYFVDDAYGVVV